MTSFSHQRFNQFTKRNISSSKRVTLLLFSPIAYILIVMNASYFLPFAEITYSMHVVSKGYTPSERQTKNTTTLNNITTATTHSAVEADISIITQDIPIDIYLIKCMGGICGSSRDTIRENLNLLKSVGNTRQVDVGQDNDNVEGDGRITENDHSEGSFLTVIESIYEITATIFHCDTDNLSGDGQIEPFVTAAVFLIPFLLLGFAFAVMSLLVQFFPVIIKRIGILKECMSPSRYNRKCHRLARMINGTNTFLCLLISALYPSLIWHQIFGQRGARFGMGYKILLLYTVLDCSLALGIVSGCFRWWNALFIRLKSYVRVD